MKGRVYQHREKLAPGFTSRYNVNKLVYYEALDDPIEAIAREKQAVARGLPASPATGLPRRPPRELHAAGSSQ